MCTGLTVTWTLILILTLTTLYLCISIAKWMCHSFCIHRLLWGSTVGHPSNSWASCLLMCCGLYNHLTSCNMLMFGVAELLWQESSTPFCYYCYIRNRRAYMFYRCFFSDRKKWDNRSRNGWTDFHETLTKWYRETWSLKRRAAAWRKSCRLLANGECWFA